MTVLIGLIMGSAVGVKSFLYGLFGAFALFAVACFSIALADGFFWSGSFGRYPLVVIAGSKNVNGDVAALGTMIAATMLVFALRRRNPALALASVAMMLLELILVRAALSTGAIVSMCVGMAVIAILTFASILPPPARSLGMVGGLLFAGTAALTQKVWLQPLLSTILKASGKDNTFTGRKYIWSRADMLIEHRPRLGLGFGAFWQPGNLEAEAIWRRLFITNRFGFNFHNTKLDLLVHLGYVGLSLFIVIFSVYGVILLVRSLRHPEPVGIFLFSVLCYEATRMGFESIGCGTFHHATFLLFAGLAWATRAGETAPLGRELATPRRDRTSMIGRGAPRFLSGRSLPG